ncbi:glycosyltransferase [Mycetocola sp. 2940]|uniref:glycosyltransferase n=1 Tax=Mycetocola sp. 2940 TaxID=3156452 RepID=UPI003390FC15
MASVLLCSTPFHGHIMPLTAVARYLVARGHRVRFLTGSNYRGAVEATGATFLPLPAEADYDDTDMDASFPDRVGRSGLDGVRWDASNIFLRPAAAQLRAVDEALAAEPVDAVLVESTFVAAALLLMRQKRPTVVYLGLSPLALPSVDTAPFGLGIQPLRGPLGPVRNRLLALFVEKVVLGPVQKEAEQIAKDLTGEQARGFFMNALARADAVVQFSVPSFEYPRRDLPSTVQYIGPVSRTTPSTRELPEWWPELEGSQPVVHLTQGTVANTNYDELIAPAMEALENEDVLVVVSTGGRPVSTLPKPLPANARAAEYLPHDRLLPLTDVFVSNGGYGGVHVALEHGVPLVVAGKTEDKAEVTARVAWAGVGINLKTNRPTPKQVRDAVRKVLADDRYRVASRRIGADIAASPGLAGLERVIEDLIRPSVVE